MALILYTVTVIDHVNNPNNTLANTDIVIRTTQSGAPLAIIYADEDGLITIAQPGAKTNDLGVFEFYAASANYNFTATVNGETRKIGGVNASSVMTESSGSVQDFIDAQYTTTTELATGKFGVGTCVRLKDRVMGLFLVQNGGVSNGTDILNAGNGNTAVLIHFGSVRVTWLGAVASSELSIIDTTAPVQRAYDIANCVIYDITNENEYFYHRRIKPRSNTEVMGFGYASKIKLYPANYGKLAQ